MNTLAESEQLDNGLRLEIHYDDCGEHANPRECDQLGTMVCAHRRYTLGDEQVDSIRSDFSGWRQIGRYLSLTRNAAAILPLGLHDHSGISMYVGSGPALGDSGGWDSGQVGFIYTTHERVTELCGDDPKYHEREWLEEQLRNEVKEYDLYLTGQVYGYRLIAEDGVDVDSCWGFLGDEYVKQEAKGAAELYTADEVKEGVRLRRLEEAKRLAGLAGARVIEEGAE